MAGVEYEPTGALLLSVKRPEFVTVPGSSGEARVATAYAEMPVWALLPSCRFLCGGLVTFAN